MRKHLVTLFVFFSASVVHADVITASDEHFILRLESDSALAPDALWERLIVPAAWWHPDHTYSGDAKNLTLEAKAGGLWREDWAGGSVEHGRVLLLQPGKVLRMQAPFGPLQSVGAYAVWTITVMPADKGSVVRFDVSAVAPAGAGLESLAPAVNAVKSEALRRLTETSK